MVTKEYCDGQIHALAAIKRHVDIEIKKYEELRKLAIVRKKNEWD